MAHSEPGYGGAPAQAQGLPDAYSSAPGENANRAARADGVAANRKEDQQDLQGGSNKKARMDDVQKLVAEENASRSKFPKYQGLDRWELIEKMGDGAFSNVYRARDLEGKVGEVAIKVVRKFEMNSQQVSSSTRKPRPFPVQLPCSRRTGVFEFRAIPCTNSSRTNISIRTLSQRLPRLQRCDQFQFLLPWGF